MKESCDGCRYNRSGVDCPPCDHRYSGWTDEDQRSTKTLLDEFAMAAMEGLMAMPANVVIDGKKTTSLSGYATASYGMAFYMMAERSRRDEMGNVKEVK